MNLEKGLEVLVKDWIDLHEQGGTNLSVEAVVKKLGTEKTSAMKIHTSPSQVVDIIESHLRQIPSALELAEKFMAQFSTPEDLLDDMDLDNFVCDLDILEEEGLQQP